MFNKCLALGVEDWLFLKLSIVNCQLSIVNFKKGLYVKAYEDCCYSFRPAL